MKKKVIGIIKKGEEKVYDLSVEDNHTYVTKDNNIIHHNSGIVYGSSLIINLTKRQDKDGKVLNGNFVTARPEKNRFCRPIPVEFKISFTQGMNPYVGLQEYASWDICGVQRGKFLTQKEYDKLNARDQEKCRPCKEDQFFFPSETARGICVDSGEVYPLDGFFNSKVWTEDRLKRIDEHIKSIFCYASGDAGVSDIVDMMTPTAPDEEDEVITEAGLNDQPATSSEAAPAQDGGLNVDQIFSEV